LNQLSEPEAAEAAAPARAPLPAGPARFLRANAPWLGSGVLMTLASSFGQTFFIALFAGEIRAAFGLSHGAWGGIYTIGTLASAALMLQMGALTDRTPPRRLTTAILLIFAAVCVGMAVVPAAWLLPVMIFGLRFCGQGMMSHIALVAVGRWFQASRGRAVSIVTTGYSFGEALLPISFVLLIGGVGWRASWLVAALLVLCAIPLLSLLLARDRTPGGETSAGAQPGMLGRHWNRRDMLGHWLFWVSFPGFLAQPVFGTTLFFQQVHLSALKGWPLEGFVSLMPFYTGATLASLFATGWAIDRWGAGRVLPVVMVPMAVAFALFALGDSLAIAAVAMTFLGTMQGAGAATAGAFWPEHYGTRHLGAVRAVATSVMVFASAIGPGLSGLLIDRGVDLPAQFLGMAAYALLMFVLLSVAMRRVPRVAAAAAGA
jgi:sugar phosphate permease